MKKTYISPVTVVFETQISTILTGSDGKYSLGNHNEDSTAWDQDGTIQDYTGDGDDIVISARGFSFRED